MEERPLPSCAAPLESGRASQPAIFNKTMRRLFEEHVTWTRLLIISVAATLPDRLSTGQRLARSQAEIGQTLRPFYGDWSGARMVALLREHVSRCVELVDAAKAENRAAIERARSANYDTGNEIARFFARVNPSRWPLRFVGGTMRNIIDLTLMMAFARVHGDHFVEIAAYEQLRQELLAVADLLSDGIIGQFPDTFLTADPA